MTRTNMTGDWGLAAHGAAFGPAAAALPYAAAAASLGGGIMQGLGGAAANKQQAAQAERAAQIGLIKASDTDTYMRDELQTTLANIQAIRASVGAEASPTEYAVIDKQRQTSDRQRETEVFNARAQAKSDEDAARFYRSSARMSLIGGGLSGILGAAQRLQ
jgi:hypothetical protein